MFTEIIRATAKKKKKIIWQKIWQGNVNGTAGNNYLTQKKAVRGTIKATTNTYRKE